MVPLILGLAACAQPAAGEVIQSDKPRETSPNIGVTDLTMLVNGNSDFAFDLYQTLNKEDGNVFYSPCSMSLALAMTCAGACGETKQHMADTFHFIIPQDRLHPVFNSLDIELSRRGE